jgi:hypothetical protein
MAKEDTKKDIQKISSISILQDYFSRTIDQIEEGIGAVKFLVIIISIVLVVPLVWLFTIAGDEEKTSTLDAKEQEFQNKNESRYRNPRKVGEPVEIDSIEWTLLSVKEYGSVIQAQSPELMDCKAPEKKKLIGIETTVLNKKEVAIQLKNPPLYTDPKLSFGTFLNAPLCILERNEDGSELFANQKVDPSQKLKLYIYYAIPEDSKDLRIGILDVEYLGTGTPKDVNYIGLGI